MIKYTLMEHPRPNHGDIEQPRFKAEFPGPEDWEALQGGKPRVFYKPQKPDAGWLAIHVYEQHPDEKHRFQSGIIIPTTPPHLAPEGKLHMVRKSIRRMSEDKLIERDISIPSFMDRTLHGDPCQARSESYGGGGYERIATQAEYESYLQKLDKQGYKELIFGLNVAEGGYILRPQAIANSKPLTQS